MVSPSSPRLMLVSFLAGALAVAPLALPSVAAAQDPDPAATDAEALYRQGVGAYGASDYERAVDLFRRAFERAQFIKNDEIKGIVVTTLWFNLARAQVKAYDIDADTKRLRQASDLINKYLGLDLSADERKDGESVRADVDKRLAEAERKQALAPAPPAPSSQIQPGAGLGVALPEPQADLSAESGAEQARRERDRGEIPGRGLMIGGGVTAGVGLVAGAAVTGIAAVSARNAQKDYDLATSVSDRDDAAQRGRTANTLSIAGLSAGGVLLVTGLVLATVGRLKNRRGASAGPMATRGTFGVTMGFRF